ncbi:hypothetical protein BpHYR1_012771 [Brachionus plicatilis]|uniref:Uncharacterized protein n=1 Tax=Brachionus plicatilis TaxID=10195 RepID=A0A3M7STC9_BRAPC|nr:hypothetical protein BpHYR1_012771 [Brachionus plicatilis]
MQYSSSNVQAVSRRLCNMSFILLTLFSGTFMFTLIMIIVLFVIKTWVQINDQNLTLLISETFSLAKVVDSKFVGLVVFIVSNLMTGLVNLKRVVHLLGYDEKSQK